MGRKSVVERFGILTGSAMTNSFTSNPIDTSTYDGGSFVFVWSGSATGGLAINGTLQPQGGQDMSVPLPSNNQNQGAYLNAGSNIGADMPISPNITWYNISTGFFGPGGAAAVPPFAVTGSTGLIRLGFPQFVDRWIRFQYTAISGSGAMTCSAFGKNVGA